MHYLHNISIRRFAKRDLEQFAQTVGPQITGAALNLAVITDTHDRTQLSRTFYGPNGYWHVQEQHWLTNELPIDWRVHLGDMVDGSEPAVLTMWRLRNIINDYCADSVPFVIARGNHDDNDKYAEKNRRFAGSFHPWVYHDLVWEKMAQQVGGPSVSRHGLSVFDHGNVRVITLNTSDVPVKWVAGRKNYDIKKNLAVTAAQLQELADALKGTGDRDVLILAHAPAMTRPNKPVLRFNSKPLHELLRAFNEGLKGVLNCGNHPDFGGLVSFDFSDSPGKIIAYVAGHWHLEEDFSVNGIHYSLLNNSALMGWSHGLTTRYNRRWHRRINDPSEYAGYVISVDTKARRLRVFGYGAASPKRVFAY